LTRDQVEERRVAAVRLLRAKGLSQAEIAWEMGGSRASVTRWEQDLARAGVGGLRQRRSAGRPPSLTEVPFGCARYTGIRPWECSSGWPRRG
jgi:transposase